MKKLFNFKNIDTHFIIILFGIQFTIRHKNNFNYKEAKNYGLNSPKSGIKRKEKLIISLTSFPARIEKVDLTINTLLNQTIKPDGLILYLADSQFPNKEKDLPENLLKLKKLGLEIRFCEDLRSYKKLIPALVDFPDDIIITADDDIFYPPDWLEGLYRAYLKNPKNIYTRRGCRIFIKNNKIRVLKPRDYDFDYNFPTDFNNLLMGGAGTLYPPKSLSKDIFNLDLIKNLIPTHDDIYFWAMAILNNVKIEVVGGFDYSFYYTKNAKTNGLCQNNTKSGNGITSEEAFDKIAQKYPEIIEKLRRKLKPWKKFRS